MGAADIREGTRKFILAIVTQLVGLYYMRTVGTTEKDLLGWVSEIEPVSAFGDPKFADGRLLIRLAATVDPKVVNWDLVTDGSTLEGKKLNAMYAISLARKLGATIFFAWDDITKLNKKMILVFVCSLYKLKPRTSELL